MTLLYSFPPGYIISYAILSMYAQRVPMCVSVFVCIAILGVCMGQQRYRHYPSTFMLAYIIVGGGRKKIIKKVMRAE